MNDLGSKIQYRLEREGVENIVPINHDYLYYYDAIHNERKIGIAVIVITIGFYEADKGEMVVASCINRLTNALKMANTHKEREQKYDESWLILYDMTGTTVDIYRNLHDYEQKEIHEAFNKEDKGIWSRIIWVSNFSNDYEILHGEPQKRQSNNEIPVFGKDLF